MANELTMSEEQNLQEQRGQLIEESLKQQEEVIGQTSKFASALNTAKDDLTSKVSETAEGIKKSALGAVKKIPDMALAGLDPGLAMGLKGAVGGAKGAVKGGKYVKSLFTGQRQKEKERGSGSGTSQAVQQNLQQQDNQSDELSKIRDNTAGIKTEVANLAAILKGDRLDKLERRREEARQDDQMLAALQSIEVGAGAAGTADAEEEDAGGIGGIFSNLKDKLLKAVGAFAALKATLSVFRSRIGNTGKAVANAGRRVAQTSRAAASGATRAARSTTGAAGRAAQRIAGGSRAAISGGSSGAQTFRDTQAGRQASTAAQRVTGGSAAASAAGNSGRMGAAAVKYPKLLKFAKFIRGVPGLAPLAAGVEGILVASDDEMPPEEKKKELARILGGALGGAGGAKLGAILGSFALPGLGTLAGVLAGGGAGYFLGGAISKKIAGALLESPSNEAPPLPGTKPSSDSVPRGAAGPQTSAIGGSSTPSAGRMPRGRSREIDRVRTDRSAAESSGRMPSGNNGGGNTNISNNIQNNRQAIIRNRPSAGSEPDNVSDTIMEAWAP